MCCLLKIVKILSFGLCVNAAALSGAADAPRWPAGGKQASLRSSKLRIARGASDMRRRWAESHRFIGVILGVTIFILLPAFFIAGAVDCARVKPGLSCSIVRLAFGNLPSR